MNWKACLSRTGTGVLSQRRVSDIRGADVDRTVVLIVDDVPANLLAQLERLGWSFGQFP